MPHPNLSPSATPLQQLSASPRRNPWVSSSPIWKLRWVTTSSRTLRFLNLYPRHRLSPLPSHSQRRKLRLGSPQLQRSIGLCPRLVPELALRSPATPRQPQRLPVFPLSPAARRLLCPGPPRNLPPFLPRPRAPRPLPSPKTPASISRKCSESSNRISKPAPPPPKKIPRLTTISA